MSAGYFSCFGKGKSLHVLAWRDDAIPGRFRRGCRVTDEGNSGIFQKTPPPRRLGGQDEQKFKG